MNNSRILSIIISAQDKASEVLKRVESRTESFSSKVGAKLQQVAGIALKTTAGIATGIAAMAIGGGISRALNIEDAQAKLKGLGHDTQSIEKIMESALASVKGTAYGLGDAATLAATAVAAGVKPGEDLTKYLTLAGDAATIAGVSINEMGSVFGKVQTQQKAYTQELNMLADRGIPIYQWLQEELGVTQEELSKMVSAGEIDSQTYFNAIQKNIGGAALESGSTTRGAWANMLAALSRIGEKIVNGPIANLRDGFGAATKFLDENSSTIVGAVQGVMTKLEGLAQGARDVSSEVSSYLSPKLEALWGVISKKLIPAIETFYQGYIRPLIPALGSVLVGAVGLAVDVMTKLASAVAFVLNNFRVFLPIIAGATAAWLGYKAVIIASNAVMAIQSALIYASGTRMLVYNGSIIAVNGAVTAATVAQTAWNAVLAMNPIGLVIGAVAGLVAILATAMASTDSNTNATDRLNEARRIQREQAEAAKQAENNLKDAQLGVERATLNVELATRRYNEAVSTYGAESYEARDAALALKDANRELERSNDTAKQSFESLALNVDNVKTALNNLNGTTATVSVVGDVTAWKQDGKTYFGGGFATGGYTGRGGMNDVAGLVHKGEYVLKQSEVDQTTGQPDWSKILPNMSGGSTINIYGDQNFTNASDVDRFFDRLDRMRQLEASGVGV